MSDLFDTVGPYAEAAHTVRWWSDPEGFHHRMRADPRFAAEISFCNERGIPHSIFLGRLWPNPDDPTEPQWLDVDQDVAMAHHTWAGQVCPHCGLHPLDWPTERSETWKGVLSTCWGCVEVADTMSTIPKDVSEERRRHIRAHLVPRTESERLILEAYDADRIGFDELQDLLSGEHQGLA